MMRGLSSFRPPIGGISAGGWLCGAAALVLAAGFAPAYAQQFAQESGEVPIGAFELQGQGLAVGSSPGSSAPTSSSNEPDSSSRWFLQRFELSLRESRDARQAVLDEAEGELKNGRAAAAQRLFERLIADAPESEEARTARSHLAELYRPKRDVPSVAVSSSDELMRNATRVSQAMDEEFVTKAGDRVFFAEGKADLGQRARAVVQAQARYLKGKPDLAVVVEGHVDDGSMSPEEADALAQARAEAVRDLLVSEGVPARRIMAHSKGRDERVAPCDDSQCRAQNRRVVTVLMFAEGTRMPIRASKSMSPPSPSSE